MPRLLGKSVKMKSVLFVQPGKFLMGRHIECNLILLKVMLRHLSVMCLRVNVDVCHQ